MALDSDLNNFAFDLAMQTFASPYFFLLLCPFSPSKNNNQLHNNNLDLYLNTVHNYDITKKIPENANYKMYNKC